MNSPFRRLRELAYVPLCKPATYPGGWDSEYDQSDWVPRGGKVDRNDDDCGNAT